MSVNLNLPYYNSIAPSSTDVIGQFHCPVCGQDQSKRTWFNIDYAVPQQPVIDTNLRVAVIIPAHNDLATGLPCAGGGQQIQLYFALHKDATHPLNCFFSPNPIPANWWQR